MCIYICICNIYTLYIYILYIAQGIYIYSVLGHAGTLKVKDKEMLRSIGWGRIWSSDNNFDIMPDPKDPPLLLVRILLRRETQAHHSARHLHVCTELLREARAWGR